MSSSVTSTEIIKLNLVHNKDCLLVMGHNPAVVGEAGVVFLPTLCGPRSTTELLASHSGHGLEEFTQNF